MKLFSLPDGTIDRKDRAQWFTVPFDLAFGQQVSNPSAGIEFAFDAEKPHYAFAKERPHYAFASEKPHFAYQEQ